MRVTRLDEARDAALALLRLGCRAVLLKGGHLGGAHAVDLLAIAPRERKSIARRREAPRRRRSTSSRRRASRCRRSTAAAASSPR